MKTFRFTAHIEREDDELEVAVAYSVTPYIPATMLQPAEGNEIEIRSAEFVESDTHPSPLTEAEFDAIKAQIEQRMDEDLAADLAEEADYKYEQMRERRHEARS